MVNLFQITYNHSKSFSTCFKRINCCLSELDIKVPLIDPTKYIVKVANNLNFDEKSAKRSLLFFAIQPVGVWSTF
jgi:transcription initiation factor TFIIIB Brf1 subunit/transcription initiation factor TFIIB